MKSLLQRFLLRYLLILTYLRPKRDFRNPRIPNEFDTRIAKQMLNLKIEFVKFHSRIKQLQHPQFWMEFTYGEECLTFSNCVAALELKKYQIQLAMKSVEKFAIMRRSGLFPANVDEIIMSFVDESLILKFNIGAES